MKFRTFFMAVMAGAALLVGCNKEVDYGPAKVALDQTNLTFEVAGGSQAVSLTATRDWAATGVPEWIALSATNGKAAVEAQPLKITVMQNTEYDRSATLVFTIGFARTSLIINQAGPNGQVDNGDGTLENPFKVAGVIEYVNELGADVNSPKKVFVKGKVSALDKQESNQFGGTGNTFGNGSFTMSDDGSVNGGQFTAYRINYLGNKKFAAGDTPVAVGDEVIVYGNVVNYKGNTPETQLNQAFLYSLNGVNRGGVDAGSGEDGEEVPDENLEPADENNIAGLVAKIDKAATQSAPTAIADFALTSATVTYVNGSSAYIEDKSGAVLLYKSGHGLKAGDVLSGTLSTSGYYRYGVPQLTSLDGITPTAGEAPAPTEMTIEYLLSTYSSQLSRFLIIKDITVSTGMSGRNAVISQGDKSVNVYAGLSSGLNLAQDATGDIIVFPTLYNTTKQVSFWDNSHFTGNGSEPGGDEPGGDETEYTYEAVTGSTIKVNNEISWSEATDATYGKGFEAVSGNIKLGLYKHESNVDLKTPDQYSARVYVSSVFVVSTVDGSDLTAIEFTASDPYNETDYAQPLKVLEGGNGTVPANTETKKIGTWKGAASKVVFQAALKQVRLVSMTYAPGDGGGDEPGDEPGDVTPGTAGTYSFQFSDVSALSWPTAKGAGASTQVYPLNGVNYTFTLSDNVYTSTYNGSSYLMLASKTAAAPVYLGLPALEGLRLVKVAVTTSSGASKSAHGVVTSDLSGTVVSGGEDKTLSEQSTEYTWKLTGTEAGKVYYYSSPSATYNSQIVKLDLTYSDGEGGDEPGGEEPGGDQPGTDEPSLPVNDGLTEATAFTVQDAIYMAKNGTEDKEYFVKAVVGKDISIKNGTASFELVDGTTDGKLTVVKAKSFGGEDFANDAPIEWLDEVILKGKVTEYSTLPALVNGQLVKWNGYVSFSGDEPAGGGESCGDGTLENPYNVTGVIEYLNELGADVYSPKKVFVKGKVSALASKESDQFGGNTFGNGSFTMSDDGSVNGGQFTAYRINYLGNKKFAAGDTPVAVGDEVIVYGNVVNYKGNTPETQQNQAFLYSLNGENRGGVEEEPGGEPGDEPSVDEKGTGTLEDPYNAAKANAVASALGKNAKSDEVYVKGKISSIKSVFGTQYGTAIFNISDDGTTTGSQFTCYGVYYLGNRAWEEGDAQVAVGDEVIIHGKLMNYNGTPETSNKEAYVYSINGKTSIEQTPVFGVAKTEISVAATATTATINVTGNVVWTATSTDVTLDVDEGEGAKAITATFDANTDTENAKTYTVKVSTTADVTTKEYTVTITQAKASSGNETVVSVDFIAQNNDLPQGSGNKLKDGTYTLGGQTFVMHAADGFYQGMNGANYYLLIGKKDSYIQLPAITGKALTKISFKTGEQASTSVIVDVTKDGTALNVNTSALNKGTEYSWDVAGEAGVAYRLQVMSAHNAQFQYLELKYE